MELRGEKELADFPHVEKGGKQVIESLPNGYCPYFIDEKCSVYERRPLVCRIYDCRVFIYVGVLPASEGEEYPLTQALKRWAYPPMNTREDREAFLAMRIRVVELVTQEPEIDSTVLAMLALLTYDQALPKAKEVWKKMLDNPQLADTMIKQFIENKGV